MERKLDKSPTIKDMGIGFTPGVRFYFQYDELEKHPQSVHDGFLPIKVKDEVVLSDYVYAVIIPQEYIEQIETLIPENIKDRTYYLSHENMDVWQWSEKVYSFVHNIKESNK